MIGVIDYKTGNAPSVLNALNKLNIDSKLISSSEELKLCSAVILPGVGSAKATIKSLNELNLIKELENKVLHEEMPFLGICIGLQILFEHSGEGDTKCLGWFKGYVRKLPQEMVRVPHIGWNEAEFIKDHPVLSGLKKTDFFYFVNSYYAIPENNDIILAKTTYGINFCSMIADKNIVATQFHLEKSGPVGLKILKNFASIEGVSLC